MTFETACAFAAGLPLRPADAISCAPTVRFGDVKLICLDMEGVITPEIWIELAKRTGIEELRRTTRDEPDYDALMSDRLALLDRHGLGMEALAPVIDGFEPLPGARRFIDAVRTRYQLVILSDTFYEFSGPLMKKLGWPTLFCHRLDIDASGRICDYRLRLADHKRLTVEAFRRLNYVVEAVGDSYNDIGMLDEADSGFLFRPPPNVVEEFPQFPVFAEYDDLLEAFGAERPAVSEPRRATG